MFSWFQTFAVWVHSHRSYELDALWRCNRVFRNVETYSDAYESPKWRHTIFWFVIQFLKCSENLFIKYVNQMHCTADLSMTSVIVLDVFCHVTTIHCHDKSFFLSSFFLSVFVPMCWTCTVLYLKGSGFLIITLPYRYKIDRGAVLCCSWCEGVYIIRCLCSFYESAAVISLWAIPR